MQETAKQMLVLERNFQNLKVVSELPWAPPAALSPQALAGAPQPAFSANQGTEGTTSEATGSGVCSVSLLALFMSLGPRRMSLFTKKAPFKIKECQGGTATHASP